MKVFYGFFKVFIPVGSIMISPTVYNQMGVWGVILLVLFMLAGEHYFTKKARNLERDNIIDRFPILKELDSGDRLTLTLKDGKTLSNFIFCSFDEYDIMVTREMTVEQIMAGKDDTRWIKLNKISAIEVT